MSVEDKQHLAPTTPNGSSVEGELIPVMTGSLMLETKNEKVKMANKSLETY